MRPLHMTSTGWCSKWGQEAGPTDEFVVRCSGAATLAYLVASWIGLPHPVWATMSAVIVSQESFSETQSSLRGRIVGTIIGVVTAVAVHAALAGRGNVAATVAICAVIARGRPGLRVSMWTGPIVILTAQPSSPFLAAASGRLSEVILGAQVGGALHWAAAYLWYPQAAEQPLYGNSQE